MSSESAPTYPLKQMQADGTWKTIAHLTVDEAQALKARHEQMVSATETLLDAAASAEKSLQSVDRMLRDLGH